MIKVVWPLDWPQDDVEVCDWLNELVEQSPGELTFEFKSPCLFFKREEDAIAFKLRFGL